MGQKNIETDFMHIKIKSENKEVNKLKYDVVIIDTGVDKLFQTDGISIQKKKRRVIFSKNISDKIGHGTAINSIIQKRVPASKVFNIRIYTESSADPDLLLFALKYIYNNIECKVINISLGVSCYNKLNLLYEQCQFLIDKNIFIVSAFDNSGVISYPAAFNNVIGVDAASIDLSINEFDYIENSIIDIKGSLKEQILNWSNGSYKNVSGASFIAPYITLKILSIIEMHNNRLNFFQIKNELKKSAQKTIILEEESKINKFNFKISKAIAFPFNKEIYPLARFKKRLSFDISFYDVKYLGNVDKKLSEIFADIKSDERVLNYEKINWTDDFDTIILGHLSDLSIIIKKDLLTYFVNKAIKYKKNIFSFFKIPDAAMNDLYKNNINIYFPYVNNDFHNNNFGKLYNISTPTIGIFGTGQRQGKYTLALHLIDLLEHADYKVNALGTEPNGELLGLDYVYPIGYESTVYLSGYDSIAYINQLMRRMELNNPDIIFVISQSQTVPFINGALKFYPLSQYELILGANPDCYILCVTISDEVEYVIRTIKYLESIFNSKVIYIVVFPFYNYKKWSIIGNKMHNVSIKEINSYLRKLRMRTNKPCINMIAKEAYQKIGKKIINYFR